MDAEINYLQRDAVTLRITVDRNRAAMDESGYTEETTPAEGDDKYDMKRLNKITV